MIDPVMLFVKPNAISVEDKATLKEAGVIVIEVERPNDVKLVRAHSELSGGELLQAAARAISETPDGSFANEVRKKFANAVCAAIVAQQ